MTEQELRERLTDRWWRLNNLYYIQDKKGKVVKFKLNAAQAFFYKFMWYRNLILKARQLGFTTFQMIFMLDASLFCANTKCAVIAHNKEDAGRLFREKIKFAYDNLPASIRAEMPANTDRAGELEFANNSSITVGTSFRGGTLKYLHVSEFGKICAKYPDKAREIVTGAFEAVGSECVITIESTAEGKQGYFFDYSQKAELNQKACMELSNLDWEFFFFPWYQEPNYRLKADKVIPERLEIYFSKLENELEITLNHEQKQWYFAKESTLGEDMKREYPSTPAEAFESSIEGAYYARQFDQIYRENRICKVPHEPSSQVHTFWDLGVNDMTCIWFIQAIGREYRVIDYYENSGEGLTHYVEYLRERSSKLGYNYGLHVAPHDIGHREFTTGLTRLEQAANMGIHFEVAEKLSINDGIEACRAILPLCVFDKAKTEKGVNGLQSYRKDWDDKNGVWKNRPLHNEASHPADSFRTFAVSARTLHHLLTSNYGQTARVTENNNTGGWD